MAKRGNLKRSVDVEVERWNVLDIDNDFALLLIWSSAKRTARRISDLTTWRSFPAEDQSIFASELFIWRRFNADSPDATEPRFTM